MKQKFKEIELSVLKMQDLRGDEGHYKTVLSFANVLLNKLNAKEEIVVPAAIFHDIGYSGVEKKKLFDLMSKKLSEEEEKEIKDFHMRTGALIAKKVLEKVNYPLEFIEPIVTIVLRHDLKDVPESIEESIVRDADKLWRYSHKGFFLDVKRRSWSPSDWHHKLLGNLSKKDYFFLDISKEIALSELNDRKKEFEE